ncbi:MAG: CoA transferase [Rhodobiaceae bacterium]|nr:CoA transferase [Rhodobiaceae bacterium]MCC0057318.1 CoA transferase [Rhodobiaceae bacterium]
MAVSPGHGPLHGIRIVEFAGVGPGPFCAMLLADMGADIISVDRKVPHGLGIKKEPRFNPTTRSRKSMAVDLKTDEGKALVLRLIEQADGSIEGNRPGVMERLGLGPDVCLKHNPRLVYGRMTGWGQEGPMAKEVGHDLNYLALSGMLSMIGSKEVGPAIPLNLMADYAGGGLYLALGMLAGLLEAKTSEKGQVVDAAMLDGLGSLMTHQFGFIGSGRWVRERGANFLDGGAPWYNVYETKDGEWISVAPVEPKFYEVLLTTMGLDPASVPDQLDSSSWPALKKQFADIFRSKTRDEWCRIMDGKEACFSPVLSTDEAMAHPHMQARHAYVDVDGVVQPAPAPRFSRTPAAVRRPPAVPGENTDEILEEWGVDAGERDTLRKNGVIA